jgi:hypothetical protein
MCERQLGLGFALSVFPVQTLEGVAQLKSKLAYTTLQSHASGEAEYSRVIADTHVLTEPDISCANDNF